MIIVHKYLGIPHVYGQFDCIHLVQQFYTQELGVSFDLPPYSHSRSWMRDFSTEKVDAWASNYGKKVLLTAAKNYDLMVFKSDKSNMVIHFGIYIAANRMLHIEEGRTSCVENLSDYWITHLHAMYRHDNLV